MLSLLPMAASAQEERPKPRKVDAAIDRGLNFLAKDALAWKKKHNCVSCHHAGLVIWSMQEAKQRGRAIDEPVLADLTKWVAESGDGKTGVPRPEGVPKALNAKAVWLALALGADAKPDDVAQKGLKALLKTVASDQTENGSWASWPETRPPIFGNSDESMTALATLALLLQALSGDDAAKSTSVGMKFVGDSAVCRIILGVVHCIPQKEGRLVSVPVKHGLDRCIEVKLVPAL
jgi:hypothetical protein